MMRDATIYPIRTKIERVQVWPRECSVCRETFLATHPRCAICGPGCRKRRNKIKSGRQRAYYLSHRDAINERRRIEWHQGDGAVIHKITRGWGVSAAEARQMLNEGRMPA